MLSKLGPVVAALALWLSIAGPAQAASPAETELRADVESVIQGLETGTDGLLKWEGADRIDVRPQGDGAVAEIGNARVTIQASDAKPARLILDRIEIRRAPGPNNSVALDIVLPQEAVLHGADGEEARLTLKDAVAGVVLDPVRNRVRASRASFAGARIEDKKNGDWLAFGPLSASTKLAAAGDGGWEGPIAVELKGIEFFFSDGPVGGRIERFAYSAEAAGPDLAALDRMRDRLDEVQRQEKAPPDARLDALFDLLPGLPSLLSRAKSEFVMEQLAVRAPTGEPLVAMDKGSIGAALTGLSGQTAALRLTMRQEGLSVAGSLVEKRMVPRRLVVDIGLEEIETAPLRAILEAAKNKDATQQLLGAAARLSPLLRIYELAVDTPDIGVEATAELKGSPLAPQGYRAEGAVAVRGFEELPGLIGPAPLAEFLPLLKEIGTPATGGDGVPRIRFQLTSVPPKWLTINGSDVSAWFADDGPSSAGRILRPAEPVMTGADVRAVQRALGAAKVEAPQSGSYDGPTAVAVARFQRQNGLNVDGVVDAATRQKLGIRPEPAQPGGRRRTN